MAGSELPKERKKRVTELSRKRSVGVSAHSNTDLDSQISGTVVSLYNEIPQVEAIYLRQSDSRTKIWVFSSESEYDSGLADKLASKESTLLSTFDHTDILVRHVPSVLYPNHRDVVETLAELIYKMS